MEIYTLQVSFSFCILTCEFYFNLDICLIVKFVLDRHCRFKRIKLMFYSGGVLGG